MPKSKEMAPDGTDGSDEMVTEQERQTNQRGEMKREKDTRKRKTRSGAKVSRYSKLTDERERQERKSK